MPKEGTLVRYRRPGKEEIPLPGVVIKKGWESVVIETTSAPGHEVQILVPLTQVCGKV